MFLSNFTIIKKLNPSYLVNYYDDSKSQYTERERERERERELVKPFPSAGKHKLVSE